MAKAADIQQTVAAGKAPALVGGSGLNAMLSRMDIKKRFEEILGKKSAGFISSITSTVNGNSKLKEANPLTVISAAVMAATLDLPINSNLGFAHIVPYKGEAQFQMGWKGFVQLGIRTGQYKTMNASEVYEDEIKTWNPITGEIEYSPRETWKMRDEGRTEKIIGFVAFFKLLNGFEKYLFMTTEQVKAHAKRYSQSYGRDFSAWTTNFDAMAKKTVMKLLLSKFGVLSIEMQRAITADQAVIVEAGRSGEDAVLTYTDAAQVEQPEQDEAAGTAQEPA